MKSSAGPSRAFRGKGREEELTQTRYCQPALYVHGCACLAALSEEFGDLLPVAAAGLSLGEFTAHAAAGTFDFETGLRLVATRGQLMQDACEQTSGAMAAMLGADESAVRTLASECDVDVANLNSPGQIVISGESRKVALAVSLAKEHGIRAAKTLNVAGAYHSRLMNSAFVALGQVLAETQLRKPVFPGHLQRRCAAGAGGGGDPPVAAGSGHRHGALDGIDRAHGRRRKCELFLELGPRRGAGRAAEPHPQRHALHLGDGRGLGRLCRRLVARAAKRARGKLRRPIAHAV